MKVIISLISNDITYKRDDEMDGRIIKDIVFKRDGYAGINKGAENEAHYLIVLENRLTDKDVVFKFIPYSKMDELVFAEIEKEEPDNEDKVNMKRA